MGLLLETDCCMQSARRVFSFSAVAGSFGCRHGARPLSFGENCDLCPGKM